MALVAVVAFAEETIFRGYLLYRFTAIFKSTLGAVVMSSVVFSLGHGNEGVSSMLVTFAMGLLLSLVYLWKGSLVAPMVIHFLQNFLGLVLLPALR